MKPEVQALSIKHTHTRVPLPPPPLSYVDRYALATEPRCPRILVLVKYHFFANSNFNRIKRTWLLHG